MNKFSRDLTLALNKVCFSQDFKFFFTSRHSHCPDGLTIGVEGESKDDYRLFLTIRHYGYENSSNRGVSKYDDMLDFYPGKFDFTEDHLETVLEYFKTRKPELYENYMVGVTISPEGE